MARRVGVDKFAYVRALRGRTDITPAEFQLLMMVWSYTDQNGRNARPGTDRLTEDLGKQDARGVRRLLQALVDKRYLSVMTAGGGRSAATTYALALPSDANYAVTPDLQLTLLEGGL